MIYSSSTVIKSDSKFQFLDRFHRSQVIHDRMIRGTEVLEGELGEAPVPICIEVGFLEARGHMQPTNKYCCCSNLELFTV